ncbi:DinB family protein [Marinigracilibium pacificum]|uniref:DinB family protein n=1 Tax=Marinigracilibium pacificum TaxID=2729599 RepID=A0A848J1V4_9BACT|nr:DinB family protein [Marinigracilibium pacificum]NMM50803.1 DinB family protein [Marinigracilibium pacificum]
MKDTVNKLKQLLNSGKKYISNSSESDLSLKPAPEKWSKKEILGHLIDSAINNLQRFTEIQFEDKPYPIRKYNQDELVKANDYQNAEITELLNFWLALNQRIVSVMNQQTEETLNYKIDFGKGEISDLRFLMTDYVDHLEHHLKQIF